MFYNSAATLPPRRPRSHPAYVDPTWQPTWILTQLHCRDVSAAPLRSGPDSQTVGRCDGSPTVGCECGGRTAASGRVWAALQRRRAVTADGRAAGGPDRLLVSHSRPPPVRGSTARPGSDMTCPPRRSAHQVVMTDRAMASSIACLLRHCCITCPVQYTGTTESRVHVTTFSTDYSLPWTPKANNMLKLSSTHEQ